MFNFAQPIVTKTKYKQQHSTLDSAQVVKFLSTTTRVFPKWFLGTVCVFNTTLNGKSLPFPITYSHTLHSDVGVAKNTAVTNLPPCYVYLQTDDIRQMTMKARKKREDTFDRWWGSTEHITLHTHTHREREREREHFEGKERWYQYFRCTFIALTSDGLKTIWNKIKFYLVLKLNRLFNFWHICHK